MSTTLPRQPQPLSPELRTCLESDLAFRRETGRAWLGLAVSIGLAATVYMGWLGLYSANAIPTVVPMCIAAALGAVAVLWALVLGRGHTAAVRAVLADGQMVVVEGVLDTAEILPAVDAPGSQLPTYRVGGAAYPVVEESPCCEERLGFVTRQVQGPAAGTRVRLCFSAVRPAHLLQVDYPALFAPPPADAPMQSSDWVRLMARPRAVIRAAGWICGGLLLGMAVLAFLPAVSRGFTSWLGTAVWVTALWALWQCLPYLRMWGRRGQVRRVTITGPVQETMQATQRASRQGAEHAAFVRVGGRWHRIEPDGMPATREFAYAVLGTHRLALPPSSARRAGTSR
ncbi:hypothetical protein [Stenotrophomonas sp.]|uniref:hypothetical protein n=1 Tax=Stenotrophomonas sp. TaxID=69392 RepID=UPI002FC67110